MSVNAQIYKGIVLAESQGQDVSELIATMANMPNLGAIVGGVPQPFGEAAVYEGLTKARKQHAETIKKEKRKAEREAKLAAQNALRAEAEDFSFPDNVDTDALRDLFDRAKALDAYLALHVGDVVTLTVEGLKAPRGGPSGGGKPAKDQPRPFVDTKGGRVFGSLTIWAKENVSEPILKTAKHTDKGKLRGGKVLVTFLTNTHKVGAETVGPWLKRDDGAAFQTALTAWKKNRM